MKSILIFALFFLDIVAYSNDFIVPNDPYFKEQWNLHNNGPFRNKDKKGLIAGSDSAQILEAWNLILNDRNSGSISKIGEEIKIAFIDDGFDLKHEDLMQKNFEI